MIKIIIGANYGDEGKGRTVAHFSNENTINILTNGGAQRGHTADNHIFHHFGSGTKRGAISYFFESFLIDPIIFLKEYKELGYTPICYRDPNCRWVTPYDVITNQLLEKSRKERHGSCGMGIWQTIKRYYDMFKGSGYLMNIDKFNAMYHSEKIGTLMYIREYCHDILTKEGIEVPYYFHSNVIIDNYIEDMNLFGRLVKTKNLREFDNKDWIFENGQGLLLNSDPNNVHTTPTQTGCKRIINYLKFNGLDKEDIEIIYVTRPYLTRHGNGPFNECSREELGVNIDKTNVYNEFQGNIRYGKLDVKELLKRIDSDFSNAREYKKSLSITHLDEMNLEIDEKLFHKVYKFHNS